MANNKLINVSKEMISSNEQMDAFLEGIKAHTYQIFPETLNFGISPEFKLSATLVSVDVKNPRDVYPVDGGRLALHLSKVNEIAQAAGLKITDSRILERKTDERGSVIYISHQVKWEMLSIDGSMKEGVVTGKYDYFNDKTTKTDGQTKSRRKHAEALAESNALTRAFNKAIAKLPQSFTASELSKPFLVPCVVQDKKELLKDLDPEVQKEIKADYARKQLGITTQIYPGTPQISLPESNIPKVNNSTNENVKKITEAEIVDDDKLSKEEENGIIAEEFRHVQQSERTQKIMNLIKIKGWVHPQGVAVTSAMIDKAPIEIQISRIEELLSMSDPISEEVGL